MTGAGGEETVSEAVGRLRRLYGHLDGGALLRPLIEREFPGRIALASSFGAESALLLALVAEIDPTTPVLFLETGKLFPETLAYRRLLAARLGLAGVRDVCPDPREIAAADGAGELWRRGPDACCALRKTRPLARALFPFAAWITGRKRYQEGERARLDVVESDGRWVKINPLARWSRERVEAEIEARGLPRHPLVERGYPSIGCRPCTGRVAPGESLRAGRWAGREKTECGIHQARRADR